MGARKGKEGDRRRADKDGSECGNQQRGRRDGERLWKGSGGHQFEYLQIFRDMREDSCNYLGDGSHK